MVVRYTRRLAGLLGVGVLALCASLAGACDVPVFRYALEYWPAVPYEVTVLHRGPLSGREQETLRRTGGAPAPGGPRANVTSLAVDLASPSAADAQRLWGELGRPALPLLVLHDTHTRRPIWSGPLTVDSVGKVVDSPARREIARRLLEGHSAVWVLLQSGDRARDAAAQARLESTLRDLERKLKLPVAQGSAPSSRDDATAPARPPLQLRFSLLTVSRHDAAESVFVEVLLSSEPDLHRYAGEPIVFPIYGRGRVLYALVGKGITRENLEEAGGFLVGSCSCEAKEQNPGTDLLMAADWEGRLVGSAQQAAGPQPLVGFATLSKAAKTAQVAPVHDAPAPAPAATEARPPDPAPPRSTAKPRAPSTARPPAEVSVVAPHASAPVRAGASSPGPSGAPLRNTLLALAAIVAVGALLGALAARRRPEERP